MDFKNLLYALVIWNCIYLGRLEGLDKFPSAVYNPWFSYVMLKWLTATNPQLAAKLLDSFPRGAPVQYHTLAGTAVHFSHASPISRLLHFKFDRPYLHKTDNFVSSQVTGQYKFDGIVEAATSALKKLVAVAKPNVTTFVKYAKVELTPPMPWELGQLGKDVKNLVTAVTSKRYKEITVREAWLNTLVATEVICWFYVGECIGKMKLVGYRVS